MKKIIILFFVFALALAACGTPATESPVAEATPVPPNAVIAEGHLVPARDAALSFQARGSVTEVRAKIGDKVKAGDVLARLGGPNDAAYAAAQVELTAARQAVDSLVESASLMKAKAWIALRDAKSSYEKARDLYDDMTDGSYEYQKVTYVTIRGQRVPTVETVTVDQVDDETLEDNRSDMELKKAMYDEAQRAYDRVKDGPDTDQMTLAQARLDAAEAGAAAFEVVAPFDGTVMDVNIAAGDQAGPEIWAVKIADTSAWYVETSDLTELEVVKIAVGLKATLVPDALPDAQMTGAVESIAQAFTIQGGDVQYRVKLKVDKVDPRVLWGMTVEITFEPME